MNKPASQSVCEAVQRNCHIADARHAGDDTICIYLMKMREFFRWEHGFSYAAELPRQPLSEWLSEREALWSELEDEDYAAVPVGTDAIPPFETATVNQHLLDEGLVYSAGLGQRARPHFFLARLTQREERDGYQILTCGEEYARDLSAPPAMVQGETIFLRRESLRGLLWQKLEEWRWNRLDNALGAAFACYDFERDVETALDAMTDQELDTVRLHEIGEITASRALGPQWQELLAGLPRSRTELVARAVKDLYADCLTTLPALITEQRTPSLHYYIANLTGLRRTLFPALWEAWRQWRDSGDWRVFDGLITQGREHWHDEASRLLEARQQGVDALQQATRDLIETRTL